MSLHLFQRVNERYASFLEANPKQKKYIHHKSIKNFMDSFDEFGSMQYKYKVSEMLLEYFEHVLKYDIHDVNDCKYIFDTYIHPIGKIYEQSLNFRQIHKPNAILFIFLPCIALSVLLDIHIAWVILVIALGIFFLFSEVRKMKSSKAYGYDW